MLSVDKCWYESLWSAFQHKHCSFQIYLKHRYPGRSWNLASHSIPKKKSWSWLNCQPCTWPALRHSPRKPNCHLPLRYSRKLVECSFATFQWKKTFELWALSFETAFENVTPSGIGCTCQSVVSTLQVDGLGWLGLTTKITSVVSPTAEFGGVPPVAIFPERDSGSATW